MKKNILSIAAVFAAVVLIFSACKKSDGPNNSIVGTWEATRLTSSTTTNTTPPMSENYDTTFVSGKSYVLTVRSNNTYVMVDNTETPSSKDSGTYTLIPGKVVLKDASSTTTSPMDTMNYTVNNNVLTLSQNSSYSFGGITATYSYSMTLNRK